MDFTASLGAMAMCRVFLSGWAVALALLATAPALAQKRVALVVGNDLYANLAPDQQLRRAANDARAVGDTLARLGFEVLRGENLGRQALIEKFDEFTRRLGGGDTAVFFFAGHGVSIGGGNFILPTDIPNLNPGQENLLARVAFGENDIVSDLQSRGVRVAVVMLDACRNNPLRRPGVTRSIGGERGLTRSDPVRGVFSLYSAGVGQTALDRLGDNDPDPNSVFTRVLLPTLSRPGLDLGALAVEVREEVARLAASIGHDQRPAYYDETIGGRVYLAGAPRPDAAPSSPAQSAGTAQYSLSAQPDPCAAAQAHWRSAETMDRVEAFEDHLSRFANCPFAGLARTRIADLRRKVAALPPPVRSPSRPGRPQSSGEACASLSAAAGVDRYCVSSVLPPQVGNSYDVRNLFGRSNATAWVEGVPGQGIGQWVVVEFDGLRSVKSIQVSNGYQKTQDIYSKNSRVRRVRLVFSQGETSTHRLEDRSGAQTITLDRPITAYWVQLVIEDVYPGYKYTDTAISKLFVTSEPAQ
jgi:uncharacterized caspase-like protein